MDGLDWPPNVQELIPANGQVLVIHYGDCVELASSPSCAQVVFKMPERDSAMRAALVRAEAKRHGWTSIATITLTHDQNRESFVSTR